MGSEDVDRAEARAVAPGLHIRLKDLCAHGLQHKFHNFISNVMNRLAAAYRVSWCLQLQCITKTTSVTIYAGRLVEVFHPFTGDSGTVRKYFYGACMTEEARHQGQKMSPSHLYGC